VQIKITTEDTFRRAQEDAYNSAITKCQTALEKQEGDLRQEKADAVARLTTAHAAQTEQAKQTAFQGGMVSGLILYLLVTLIVVVIVRSNKQKPSVPPGQGQQQYGAYS
jgi:hypothetical protein